MYIDQSILFTRALQYKTPGPDFWFRHFEMTAIGGEMHHNLVGDLYAISTE
jgi:hypothetical protein